MSHTIKSLLNRLLASSKLVSPIAFNWRVLICLLAFLTLTQNARGEPMDVKAADSDVTPAIAIDDFSASIDEIVVFGARDPAQIENAKRLLDDPLRVRILRDAKLLEQLEWEFEWRMEAAHLEFEPPRLRFGYDPREQLRQPPKMAQLWLPLDLIQPATLVSVDF